MSTPRISLDQWQTLVAVVDAGSHARAAEALHKTQSTVTYAIQKIESVLGVKAFDIQGRKAVLTATGHLLYRRARVLLEEAAGVESAARRVSAGWEAEIRVAMELIFPTPVIFECLARFGIESPHTRIELVESVLGGTSEALARAESLLLVRLVWIFAQQRSPPACDNQIRLQAGLDPHLLVGQISNLLLRRFRVSQKNAPRTGCVPMEEVGGSFLTLG